MTRERAEELANKFKDNYELAKKMGADNAKLVLVVALLYTLDDMNQLPYEAAAEREKAQHGNAAAVREAIVKIRDKCVIYNNDLAEEIDALCGNALSAPARNCDKMPDIDNLTMYDLANSPCKSVLEYASREELLALVRWLLAPAEQNGMISEPEKRKYDNE